MPCWYYEKKELKDTPSYHDGIDFDTESRYRKEGARCIIDTGTKMDLGYNTMATGVVYFHRFYMHHSFKTFPRYVTACCCLFLAGKVEETPKKCKDIIKTASELLSKKKFQTFGDDPKEEVMTLERILLQTIKFDLQIEHPYSFLLKYAKCLKGDKQKLEKMLQMAWTFVNDSLCTTLSLQWEPEVIAVALMYLAGKLSKFEVVDWAGRQPNHLRWWDMFVEGVTMDLLEDICHQVLDLYSQPAQPNSPDSPPMSSAPPVKKEVKPIPVVGQPIARLSPAKPIQPIVTGTKMKTDLKQQTNGSGILPPATDAAPGQYSSVQYTSGVAQYNSNTFSAPPYQQNLPLQTVSSNTSCYPPTYPPQYPPPQSNPQYQPSTNTHYPPPQQPPSSQYYPQSQSNFPSNYPPPGQ